jgi:predicted thioredoxin/glutaredoxin
MNEVVLYRKKDGCGCGGEALSALETLGRERGFRLKVLELESNAELMKRYMASAPVVVADGKVVSTGPTNLVLLRKRFKALK